jgi:hypothetical protein
MLAERGWRSDQRVSIKLTGPLVQVNNGALEVT